MGIKFFFQHIREYDWLLLGAVFILMGFGLISLLSLFEVSAFPFFPRQLVWAGVGIVCLLFSSFIDFRLFKTQTGAVLLFYGFSVVLLFAVLLGSTEVRGISAWLRVGGFAFQPVELTKLALIILLAKFFSKRHIEIYRMRHLVASGLYLALPLFLVLVQPDLGSAVVLAAIWVAVIIFSGMRLRHFGLLVFLGFALALGAWNFGLADYQKTRVTAFLNPYADPRGAGYQMIQSMIAVGSGRLWGKGLGYGSQTHLNFLPEAESDFIFAAFAEEWGFFGVSILITVLAILLWRIISIGQKSADNFSRFYAIGFASLIFAQSFIHIGTNMGVLPITGLPLPFVSYGGSSLVTLMIGVGILQNIKMNARREIE